MNEIIIDAKNKSLGRIASLAAHILQGKHASSYQPNKSGGVKVLVKNFKEVKFTGKKFTDKMYHRHTGYVGHLKSRTLEQAFTRNAEWVLKHAVKGMLPKNSLLPKRLKMLIVEK
ncbi:MAG TPA: 50S ribosomal protein L13 [Candidatus Paceibacterota bacterium]|nr:50S ribosomal protein L13 [Candidatus Paceibacterota bacterium]